MAISKRNYVRKKLPHFQILRVISRSKEGDWIMQQERGLFGVEGVPEGHFVVAEGALLLPKRRRGEKFVVHYTEVREAIL